MVRKTTWWVFALELAVLAALVAGAIACYAKPTIHTDESYHLMCSRSINAGEGLADMGERRYTRAWVFSYAVAWSQGLFGMSLTAARLPAIVSAIALALAMFAWLRVRVDRVAAWTAALLLGLSVFTLDIAQFCRFYSMHALVVFAMGVAAYEAMRPRTSAAGRGAWGIAAVAAALLALHLQESTAVALLALGVYVGSVAVWLLWTTPRIGGRGKLTGLGLLAIAAVAVIAVLIASGLWHRAWGRFTWAPRWSDPDATAWYYHELMLNWYPLLWMLGPLALLGALARCARLAIFAAVVFTVSMGAMSLSAAHTPRYIYFAMPMFFLVWGLAASAIIIPIHRRLVRRTARWLASPVARRALAPAWAGAIVLVLLYAAYRTPAYYRTLDAVRTRGTSDAIMPWGDFAGALAAVEQARPDALDAPLVLAAPKAKAMYYLPGRTIHLLGRADDGNLQRMIVTPEHLLDTLARHRRGLIVVDAAGGYWRDPRFVTDALADAIEANTTRLRTPKGSGVHVFAWPAAP